MATKIIKGLLLAAIAILLFEVVISVGSTSTGLIEKAVLVVVGGLLIVGAWRAWQIGVHRQA